VPSLNELLQFVYQHWLLWLAFAVVLILLIIEELRHKATGARSISSHGAVKLINQQHAVVIDIRDASAFTNGHIINAINIPQADLDKSINKIDKHKKKPIIICHGAGQNSTLIGAKLRKLGFEQVLSISGGISAWKKDGLPLNQKTKGT